MWPKNSPKPLPDKSSLRIGEFPKGNDVWRIDWFGEVQFPDRTRLSRHPSVNVYLSRVQNTQALTSSQAPLPQLAATPTEQQKQCTLSIGKLMLLRIGDLWQDQKPFAQPTYELETFHDLLIERGTSTLVKAGLSLEDGGFLLPLAEHPWHRRNTHSYCLRVSLPDGRSLIIPCLELVRFYFGSSSELLNQLFRPGLSKDGLCKSYKFNPSTRFMELELSDHIHSRSAADIGRIAGSAAAWRAANLGLTSCLKAIATSQGAFPQGIFPFEGITDLTVSGKWLSRSGKAQQTFLAYQIHSCSHPFPFNFLRHTGGRIQEAYDASADTRRDHSFTSHSSPPERPNLVEKDPSNRLNRAVRVFNAKRQFPDLERKTIFGSKSAGPPRPGGPGKQFDLVEEEAPGEPGSINNCRAISLIDAVAEIGEPPAWLATAYGELRQLPNAFVVLLTMNATDGWTVPLSLCPDEAGVLDIRLYVRNEQRFRPRRAAAFKIIVDSCHTTMILIEDKPPISAMQLADVELPHLLKYGIAHYLDIKAEQSKGLGWHS